MVLDERFRYTYDAWNRLVKAQAKQDADVVVQTAAYDGLGRRIEKVVTKSGDLDGTFTFYYDTVALRSPSLSAYVPDCFRTIISKLRTRLV